MEKVLRKNWRSQVTKLAKSIDEFCCAVRQRDLLDDVEQVQKNGECLLERMKNAHEELKKADGNVFQMEIPAAEMEKECDVVVEYSDKAIAGIAKLTSELKRLSAHGESEARSSSSAIEVSGMATPIGQVSQENYVRKDVKLKPLELKKFDGKFEDWLPFWEQFKLAVHENNSFAAATKFNFLSEALEGRAAAAVAGFLPSESCYKDAIALLQEEFGDHEKIVEKYLQKLINIKLVASANDVKGLRVLYNEVSATMRSLKALNIDHKQYDLIIKSILLKAMPAVLRIQYHRLMGSENAGVLSTSDTSSETSHERSVKRMLEFLKNEIEALEKSNLSEKVQFTEKDHKQDERQKSVHRNGTATSLFTANKIECAFCKLNNHETKECRSKMSIEEKKGILKREGRCYRCGNKNHISKNCRAYITCKQCNRKHITPLCEGSAERKFENGKQSNRQNISLPKESKAVYNDHTKSSTTTLSTRQHSIASIYLQTAKAIIISANNNKRCVSRIIMDNGSQRTYISEALKTYLNMKKCGTEKMQIVAFGESYGKARSYELVEFKIKGQYNDEVFNVKAVVVPSICTDMLPLPEPPKGLNIQLADDLCCEEVVVSGINLLIGQDFYWSFNSGECKTLGNDLVLVNTKFGWTVQGSDGSNKNASNEKSYAFTSTVNESGFDIDKFWSLESIGISNDNEAVELKNEAELNIRWESGRYVVNLPWINKNRALNDNKLVALRRLRALTMKLCETKKLHEYNSGIAELVKNGIAEEVTKIAEGVRVYYMPHMGVWREDKDTSKLRIVFDASSSEKGMASLNECLNVGSNMVADLMEKMLSFRSNLIALTADIEKAFLQISLDEEERDSHRFLWYKAEPTQSGHLPGIVQMRMTRVTFGVASSPFILAMTINKHLESCRERYGDVCNKLSGAFYVDDVILSVASEEEAKALAKQAYEVMRAGNFNLRKWNSNNVNVLRCLPKTIVAQSDVQKILGIYWCTRTDDIKVDVESCVDYICKLGGTKRNVLKAMGKIFDPLGILGPFTVRIKILLQRIWSAKLEWDQTLTKELLEEFSVWQHELHELADYTIGRSVISVNPASYELHIFCDASLMAYGTVAYIRQNSEGQVSSMFVCARNRIRPLKKSDSRGDLTLPKLELTAALVAARLKKFLIKSLQLDIGRVRLWSDSSIALNWIKGHGKLVPYVKARVEEINELTAEEEWRHCQGVTNPADLLTRGIKAKALIESALWKFGPEWLLSDEDAWPENIAVSNVTTVMTVASDTTQYVCIKPIFSITDFSTIRRLLRATAIMLKFVSWVRNKSKPKKSESMTKNVSCGEMFQAELYWVKCEQAQYYADEIQSLTKNNVVSQKSKIVSLNPQLVSGIMRVRSRLSVGSSGEISPVILPKHSHLSLLLVREAHHSTIHGGVNAVLTLLRRKYWVIQGRQLIKSVIRKCVVCLRLHGKSASEPWTVIPRDRVVSTRPFETTGVDFAGPLYVDSIIDGGQQKVYIMLFTCAAIRAVHLELVPDSTTKSCVEAIRRFVARRGTPAMIMSDNAKTFKRADMEIQKLNALMGHKEVQELATEKGIEWKYIPERAAWWGGFWERLVRSVKTAIKSAVGKAKLNYDELMTLLVEVEAVTNNRPLTYITDDPNDLQPLTPAHFLINNNNILISPDFNADQSEIAKSWVRRQELIKRYIKRWRTEYLSQLRTLYHNKGGLTKSVKEGDIVLMHEDNKPRLAWKLAQVITVFPGRDGRVRSCEVRLGKGQVLKRPVQLLYPLEISS